MKNRVLSFHYVLTNKQGEVLDSSKDRGPFRVLEGRKQIIPGLEEELFKMNVGDKKKVHVPAAKAYGVVDEKLKIKIERNQLPEGDIQIGTQFSTDNSDSGGHGHGPIFTVTQIEGDRVHLDGNPPLAGEDLTFDVEITEIREATANELQHGHAHGPEGHEH